MRTVSVETRVQDWTDFSLGESKRKNNTSPFIYSELTWNKMCLSPQRSSAKVEQSHNFFPQTGTKSDAFVHGYDENAAACMHLEKTSDLCRLSPGCAEDSTK